MSDTVQLGILATITALLGGLPATIAALAAFRQSKKNAEKADVTEKKGDEMVEKVNEIHTLAKGSLAEVPSALELANEKIAGLEKQVSLLVEAKLAALTSTAAIATALATTPPKPE